MIKKIAAAFLAMALVAVGMLAVNKTNVMAEPDAEAKADVYVVAGDSALCGSNWGASDSANNMSDEDGDKVYEKTYDDVAAGNYQFKIVKNGSEWIGGGDNFDANVQFAVATVCDITIKFNSLTKAIEVVGDGLTVPTLDITSITIAGAKALLGVDWDPAAAANHMELSGKKLWTKTYTGVAAGSYEFKFVANDDWPDSWGGTYTASGAEAAANYNGTNITVTTEYAVADIEIEFDLTNFDYGTKNGATFTVTVTDKTPKETPSEPDDEDPTTTAADDEDPTTTTAADDEDPTTTAADDEDPTTTAADDEDPTTAADDEDPTTAADDDEDPTTAADDEDSTTAADNGDKFYVAGAAGLCGVEWDPSKNEMTKNADGTWSITFTKVKKGNYEFKVATNGAWNNGEYNDKGDASNNGPNASVEVLQDGTTVKLVFDGTKVIVAQNEVPSGVGEDTPAGDSSASAIFAILAVLAAVGAVTVVVAKKRIVEE